MNGVKNTCSTVGTGAALVFGAVAGKPGMSDACLPGDLVTYVAKDGDNREYGIGKVGAGLTFTRLRATSTYVGGVVNRDNPPFIALSGNATFEISPISGAHPPTLRRVATNNGRKAIYSPHIAGYPSSTLALAANRLYIFAFRIDEDIPANGVGFRIATAAAAGAKARTGLYRINETAQVTDVVAESSDIAIDVTGAVFGPFANISPTPDWYGIALLTSAAVTVATYPSGAAMNQTPFGVEGAAGSMLPIIGKYKDVGAGWSALPANPASLLNFIINTSAWPALDLRLS